MNLLRIPATSLLLAFVCAALPVRNAAAADPPRPAAEPFLGMPHTSSLASASDYEVTAVFPALAFNDPVFLIPEPKSDRLWVCEREGRIVSFNNKPDVQKTREVLDLRDVTKGDGDSGLLSMAFHPEYANPESPSEGMIFAAYAHIDGEDQPLHFRVSRFLVDRSTGKADPASELVLIDQLDQHVWHQGGAIFFHPKDGYLYITLGDEGGGRCAFDNCQRIDRDLFAGVLRIDVDNLGGDKSHPPPREPQSGTTANYMIPNDNPFVGRPDSLEEFYAIGLRSPHRMTYDPVDDLVWIGEVGQSQREEIDILRAGANFQWNIMEGTVPFDETTDPPDPLVGAWTPPLYDYGRDVGGTIIGGYVYRGSAFPELAGRYVYGDFLSGRIWALRYQKNGDQVQFVDNEELLRTDLRGRTDGITSLGVDADGEIYVLSLGEAAKLYKLVPADKDPGNMPLTLSATGLFQDLENLVPIASLVPYEVRVPLWSDGAAKRRWMSVPTGSVVEYSPDGAWKFPAGTVFVKHFEMQLDRDDPGSVQRLETRVLVVQEDQQVYGVTYKWRGDGSDADLLTTTEFVDLSVENKNGEPQVQRYQFPGPIDCLTCHDPGAGHVLGLRARQLDGTASEIVGDELAWFADAGFLDVDGQGLEPGSIPEFASLGDEDAPISLRARSYLDVNCSHCHGSQEIDRSLWDARITTPLNRQGIVNGTLLGDYGGANDHVVTPGDLDSSILYQRTSTTERGLRMPPLARGVRDEEFLGVLEGWIAGMTATTLPPPLCGDSVAPYDNGISIGDALGVLRAAIATLQCADCICDVNTDGRVTASDALKVLRFSVGAGDPLECPACG